MKKLLPEGTIVLVNDFSERTYIGLIEGYDTFHTKYNIRPEIWPGLFASYPSAWAFINQVVYIPYLHKYRKAKR